MNPCRSDCPRFQSGVLGRRFQHGERSGGGVRGGGQTHRSGGSAAEAIRDAERSSFSTPLTPVGNTPTSRRRVLCLLPGSRSGVAKTRADGSDVPGRTSLARLCKMLRGLFPFSACGGKSLPVALRLFNRTFSSKNKTTKHKRRRQANKNSEAAFRDAG